MPLLPKIDWPYKIAMIGETEGETEKCMGDPFQGPAGFILDEILYKIGLPREALFISNVFQEQPPGNKIAAWATKKTAEHFGAGPPFSCVLPCGGYLRPAFWMHVNDLFDDLRAFKPDLIFALGAIPLWALTGRKDIGTARATLIHTPLDLPLIPTYHPSSVLQGSYANRVIIRADLEKGLEWLQNPSAFKKKRMVRIPSSVSDASHLKTLLLEKPEVACDIETCQGIIDMIGFAWSETESCIFPFAKTKVMGKRFVIDGPYWPTSLEFVKVWRMVQEVLEQGGKEPCPMDTLSDRLPDVSKQIYYTVKRLYR